jgi:hypothetical protein
VDVAGRITILILTEKSSWLLLIDQAPQKLKRVDEVLTRLHLVKSCPRLTEVATAVVVLGDVGVFVDGAHALHGALDDLFDRPNIFGPEDPVFADRLEEVADVVVRTARRLDDGIEWRSPRICEDVDFHLISRWPLDAEDRRIEVNATANLLAARGLHIRNIIDVHLGDGCGEWPVKFETAAHDDPMPSRIDRNDIALRINLERFTQAFTHRIFLFRTNLEHDRQHLEQLLDSLARCIPVHRDHLEDGLTMLHSLNQKRLEGRPSWSCSRGHNCCPFFVDSPLTALVCQMLLRRPSFGSIFVLEWILQQNINIVKQNKIPYF